MIGAIDSARARSTRFAFEMSFSIISNCDIFTLFSSGISCFFQAGYALKLRIPMEI